MHDSQGTSDRSTIAREPTEERLVDRLTSGLRRRYVYALIAVATLAILHQVFVQPALVRLNLYAPVINVAGRQRMLSQRLTKASLAIRADPTARERYTELGETLETWSRSHRGLRFGDPALGLPGTTSPNILAAFDELQPHFEAMLAAGRRIEARRDAETPAAERDTLAEEVGTILVHESRYLPVMDHIVGLLEQEARNQVAGLRLAGFVIMGSILVLLVLVGWFVVVPANNVIGEQFSNLAASETRYRSLVERMTDGLAVFRSGGRLEYANDRLCEMFGRPRAELVGRALTAFAVAADRGRLLEVLEGIDHSEPGAIEVEWTSTAGRCCTLVSIGRMPREPETRGVDAGSGGGALGTDHAPVEDPDATPHVYFAVVTDISDRKRAEDVLRDARDELEERVTERTAQLVSANRQLEREISERLTAEERSRGLQHQLAHAARVTAIGELATGLAHEINQPLGAIVNYVETIELLLERPEPDVELAREAIARARSSAMRAGNIIRRMRKFVQGRRQEPQIVDPNELVAEVVELCTPEIRRADVGLEVELGDVPRVRVDALGVQQVVVNLVQNAIQAMLRVPRSTRRLHVGTTCAESTHAEGFVRLVFTDTGPGFESDPEEFFQPFRSTREEGLGMGLPISRSIVREQGGELSSGPGTDGGAVVAFTLPTSAALPREGERVLV